MFTVLFGVSSGGQSFRLSSLVGKVLSLSCMDQVGLFCYIYSLANYVSINYLFIYCTVLFTFGLGRVECSGFCVLLKIVLGCSLFCLCSLAGGGSSWCCCSVHLHCSGGTELVIFSAVGLAVLKSRRLY